VNRDPSPSHSAESSATPKPPTFLLHAPQDTSNLADELGRKDYSYVFVMQAFLPVLASLGHVDIVADPAQESDKKYREAAAAGSSAFQFLFLPPHEVPLGLECPTIPVFAWEYDTIPTEAWGGESRNDWRTALSESVAAIVHSQFALSATRNAMPADFPLASIPAPIYDRFAELRSSEAPFVGDRTWTLDFDGVAVDSREQSLDHTFQVPQPSLAVTRQSVSLTGIVYTVVLNPDDGRKNWADALTAFVDAFRNEPAVTLLLKLVHHDPQRAFSRVWDWMRRLATYQCRVVAVYGYLDDENYAKMVQATSFAVNTSRGEGQCLPLMEFMSAGCPAVAPDHSAMSEYVNPDNSFVVASYREWTHWPHDPRLLLRTLSSRIEWSSLREAYLSSYQEARISTSDYLVRSANASAAQRSYCSVEQATSGIRTLLDLPDRPARA
jgi:glycosyltransferase involved in cell wall biosynthesis